MHGCGNDFIVINCLDDVLDRPEQVCEKFADRHFGIGFDGLILLERSDRADVKMRIFNADASEAMMCGNGIRCVGKYVYDKGLTDKTTVSLGKVGDKSVQFIEGLNEIIAEAHALVSGFEITPTMRATTLQQYFPRTLAYILNKL